MVTFGVYGKHPRKKQAQNLSSFPAPRHHFGLEKPENPPTFRRSENPGLLEDNTYIFQVAPPSLVLRGEKSIEKPLHL